MACVSDYKLAYTPHNKTLTCTFSSADVMNPFLLCEKSCLGPRHFHVISEVLIALPVDISVQGQKLSTREKEKPSQPPATWNLNPSLKQLWKCWQLPQKQEAAGFSSWSLQSKQGEGGSYIMKWVGSGGRISDIWGKGRVISLLMYSRTRRLKGFVVSYWWWGGEYNLNF